MSLFLTSCGGDDDYETDNNKKEEGHEYVDLGLSVKWATCNVGASSPEDYGDYFAWGETTGYNSGKTNFGWSTYKYGSGSSILTKYCTDSSEGNVDSKTTLELSDDAAHANWGGNWRMPTIAEFAELQTKCTWTWTTQNGVKGRKVTGTNGNSIFLPAAGYHDNAYFHGAGTYGLYWMTSLYNSSSIYAYYLSFDSSFFCRGGGDRIFGVSVRPVCP